MKSLTLSLGRFALVVAGALSLGACNRAEYPGVSSAAHSGSTPVASQVTVPYVPVAAEESAVVAAPALAIPRVAAVAPVDQSAPVVAAAPVVPLVAAPVAKLAPAPKFNLVQRLALRKVTKKLDKLTAQLPQLKKQDARAARGGLDGNLRSAILFGAVGIILLILGSVANIFAILGTIALIIGIVFLVLWLLDQA